jgi:hypothetical protein
VFAGLAAGLLAGVFAQFIQCGEYRSAVKVSSCNTPLPPQLFSTRADGGTLHAVHIAVVDVRPFPGACQPFGTKQGVNGGVCTVGLLPR